MNTYEVTLKVTLPPEADDGMLQNWDWNSAIKSAGWVGEFEVTSSKHIFAVEGDTLTVGSIDEAREALTRLAKPMDSYDMHKTMDVLYNQGYVKMFAHAMLDGKPLTIKDGAF